MKQGKLYPYPNPIEPIIVFLNDAGYERPVFCFYVGPAKHPDFLVVKIPERSDYFIRRNSPGYEMTVPRKDIAEIDERFDD